MKNLNNPSDLTEILTRLDGLRPDSPRQWGKMTPSQMMEHTARALEMAAGIRKSEQRLIGKLLGWIFRKDFLSERPFPKSAPTGPDFIITDDPEFDATKARLRQLIVDFHALGAESVDGNIHGFFGPLTGDEWGISQYKHVDHHLRQFNS